MLLIFMYHQIVDPKLDPEYSLSKFTAHLQMLKANYNIIVPGQTILPYKLSVCLTFDDAYIDFYHYVFPILKKLNIPAVLAIPVGLITETTKVDLATRLAVGYPHGLDHATANQAPLCTWEEIRTMVNSGLVYPASHTLQHKDLASLTLNDTYQELCLAKRTLMLKLENISDILIYPFGSYNSQVQTMANNHYRYVMRIGNAINYSWQQKILYRVDADVWWKNSKVIGKINLINWQIKYLINILRGK